MASGVSTPAQPRGQPEDSALREFFGDQPRRLLARAGQIAPGSLDEARALAAPVDFDDTPWALRGPAPEFGPSLRRPVCSRRAACEWGRRTPPREGGRMDGPAGQYPVRLQSDYSERGNRLTTFFRLLLAIPHLIVLSLLGMVAQIVLIMLWIVIIITGKLPEGLAKLLVSYLRWSTRDNAYVCLLTDEYPPFSGDESAQAAERHAAFSPGDGMLAQPP